MKKNKLAAWIFFVLSLALLSFIIYNSLQPVAESTEESLGVLAWIEPLLEKFVGAGNVTDGLVRKLAHFAEFSLLGVFIMALCAASGRARFQSLTNCLFFGLLTAVCDESLQMLTDRSPEVKDILLDFAGIIIGTLIVFAVYHIVSYLRKCKT